MSPPETGREENSFSMPSRSAVLITSSTPVQSWLDGPPRSDTWLWTSNFRIERQSGGNPTRFDAPGARAVDAGEAFCPLATDASPRTPNPAPAYLRNSLRFSVNGIAVSCLFLKRLPFERSSAATSFRLVAAPTIGNPRWHERLGGNPRSGRERQP